jgi:hypothetical protein
MFAKYFHLEGVFGPMGMGASNGTPTERTLSIWTILAIFVPFWPFLAIFVSSTQIST